MSLVKTELTFIRNIQKEYYISLLGKGDDVRGKGLVWIIGTMWDLRLKVHKTMFTPHMDELSKDFLLQVGIELLNIYLVG